MNNMQNPYGDNIENSMVLPWGNEQNNTKHNNNSPSMGSTAWQNRPDWSPPNQNTTNWDQTSWDSSGNHSGSVDVRSYPEVLFESVGRFMVCRFLVGSGNMVTVSGMLKNVGKDFFILEDPCTKMETTCDLYSVKFISVLPEDFIPNIPSYCRRRLYENAPIFSSDM